MRRLRHAIAQLEDEMDVAAEVLEAFGLVYCDENGVYDVDGCRKREFKPCHPSYVLWIGANLLVC